MANWVLNYLNISMSGAFRGLSRYTGIFHEWSIDFYNKCDGAWVLIVLADDLTGYNGLKQQFNHEYYAVEDQSRMGFMFTLCDQNDMELAFFKLKLVVPFFSEVEQDIVRAVGQSPMRVYFPEDSLTEIEEDVTEESLATPQSSSCTIM